MIFLADLTLFLVALLSGVVDGLFGHRRRRYERSALIRAPRDIVWQVASARKLRFEGPVPVDIDCAPTPGDETLVTGTITVGHKRLNVALREISERPGEAKVIQILRNGSDPALGYGDDYYVGYTLADAPGGTLMTTSHELTHTRFMGRALVPLGLAQNMRRIKAHCEKRVGIEPRPTGGLWDVVMTGLLTFASFLILYGAESAALLVVLILIHEVGHAVAMRLVGQPVQGIYFIPFFGGVAVAAAPHESEAERGFVALMGPGLSLASTALFLMVWRQTGSELAAELALLSAIVNGLNLAPLMPLDGGHITDCLLSRLEPEVSALVRFLFLLGGIGVAVALQWHILTAFLSLSLPVALFGGKAPRPLPPIGRGEQLWLATAYLSSIAFYVAAAILIVTS